MRVQPWDLDEATPRSYTPAELERLHDYYRAKIAALKKKAAG